LLQAPKGQRHFSFTPSPKKKEAQMYTGAANLKVWAAAFVGARAAVAAALVALAAALGLFAVLAGTAQPSRAACWPADPSPAG
jgi:hypothetical protein